MEENEAYIETMKKAAEIFNKNDIRYALAGGVVSEIRNGEIRSHKDIDFAIFEEDIPRITDLLGQNNISSEKQIIDANNNWIDTTGHNLIAIDEKTGVNIGFFIYSNQQEQFNEEGELVSEAGFIRKTLINYRGNIITLRERMNSELQDYLFLQDRTELVDGTNIKVQPLAYIMTFKAKNLREKDRIDLVNTMQLLSDEEIQEYNRFKNNILNIKYTAQFGEEAKEGNIDDVKMLLDKIASHKQNQDVEL